MFPMWPAVGLSYPLMTVGCLIRYGKATLRKCSAGPPPGHMRSFPARKELRPYTMGHAQPPVILALYRCSMRSCAPDRCWDGSAALPETSVGWMYDRKRISIPCREPTMSPPWMRAVHVHKASLQVARTTSSSESDLWYAPSLPAVRASVCLIELGSSTARLPLSRRRQIRLFVACSDLDNLNCAADRVSGASL